MTTAQKILIQDLLRGDHLLKTRSHSGTVSYKLYDKQMHPRRYVRARTVDTIDRLIDPKIRIWKKEKQTGFITLNLSMIRRLHGRHTIKKLYKQQFAK